MFIETGMDTRTFKGAVHAWAVSAGQPETIIDPGVVVHQTDGGEFHPYVWKTLGPPKLIAALEKIQITPGGELLKSEGGSADPSEPGPPSGGETGEASITVEAHPVDIELLAEEGALESETHQLLAGLDEEAASIVTFRPAFDNPDEELTDAELAERIQTSKTQAKARAGGDIPTTMAFGKGFVNGVWDGGVEMVGSAWGGVKLAAKTVAYGVEATAYTTTSPMRVVWRWATTEMDYDQSCVSVWNEFPQPDPELQELAKGLKEMASLAVDAAGGLVEAVLTMNEDKMAKLGGQFKDMFMLSIEVFQELWMEWKNGTDDYQKGYLTGKATSEVAGMFMPWAKVAKTLGKLSKADFLVQLGTKSKFFASGGKGAGALVRAKGTGNKFVNALQTTTSCFPAGTPVLTAKGLRPIESIRTGDLVMGRDEATGAQDWRAVVDTITTHPDVLYHLRIRGETHGERFTHRARDGVAGADGDADPDADTEDTPGLGVGQTVLGVTGAGENITTTGNHPFYVLSRPQPGFIAADELEPGDRLSLADGGTAVVEAIRRESSAPGTRFRTYNLEVTEYHTYFVGQHAVWVHNSSKAACERAAALFHKFLDKPGNSGDPWKALKDFDDRWAAMQKKRGPGAGTEDIRLRVYNEARKKHLATNPGPGPWKNLSGQDLTGTPGMSNAQRAAKLEANMQKAGVPTTAPGFAQHHLVPHTSDIGDGFSRARLVMQRNGIHLDEAANGVSMPKNVATSSGYDREFGVPHSRIHNGDYSEALASRLERAEATGKDLRDELQRIAQELADPQSDWPAGKVRW